MAATVHVTDRSTVAVNNTVTSHTVNMPSNISVGNKLMAYFFNTHIGDVPANAGWTAVSSANGNMSANTGSVHVFERTADGTEGATQTFTTSSTRNTVTICDRISGHANAATSGGPATGSTASPDPGSFSPAAGSKDYLWIAITGYSNGQSTVSTYPSGYTDGHNPRNNSASFRGGGIAYKTATAATEDPGSFTLDTARNTRSFVIAVEPAAGGGSSIVRQMLQNGLFAGRAAA